MILSQFEADLSDSERFRAILSGSERFWSDVERISAILGGFEQFALACCGPLLQPGRAAGAPGAPASVGTYVGVVLLC